MVERYVVRSEELVRVPGATSLNSGYAYHYTSASGLIGILKSKTLWASSAIQLNDDAEIRFALDVIREAVDGWSGPAAEWIEDVINEGWADSLRADTYIVSASTEPDLLTQWIHYAGATGYCLGIDMAHLIMPSVKEVTDDLRFSAPGVRLSMPGWYRVLYAREDQLAAVREVLDFADGAIEHNAASGTRLADEAFAVLAPQLKHPAFSDEREVRYITTRQHWTEEHHRAGVYGLVPYVELRRGVGDEYRATATTTEPLPVVSVHVGPTPAAEREGARDAAARLLKTYGHVGAGVHVSNIPYRHPRGA